MAQTTNWLFPYPTLSSAPDVPADIEALAKRIEAILPSTSGNSGKYLTNSGTAGSLAWATVNASTLDGHAASYFQVADADLTAIAALSGTAGFLKTNGSGTWSVATDNSSNWDTAYSWGNHASQGYLLASTASTTYQPLDSDLTTIAGLTGTDGFLKKTSGVWGVDTSSYSLTSHNHSLSSLSDVDITTLGLGKVLVWDGTKWIPDTVSGGGGGSSVQFGTGFTLDVSTDPDTVNLAPVLQSIYSSAATDKLPYFSSSTAISTITLSSNTKTFLGSADYAAMRTALGLVIGTNIQAWDSDLDGISTASGSGALRKTSGGTWEFYTPTDDNTTYTVEVGLVSSTPSLRLKDSSTTPVYDNIGFSGSVGITTTVIDENTLGISGTTYDISATSASGGANLRLTATTATTTSTDDVKLAGSGTVTVSQTDANTITITGTSSSDLTITQQSGTSYTLQASDKDDLVEFTNSSAVTVTVPSTLNDLTTGSQINILQVGTGQVTVAGINETALRYSGGASGATTVIVPFTASFTNGDYITGTGFAANTKVNGALTNTTAATYTYGGAGTSGSTSVTIKEQDTNLVGMRASATGISNILITAASLFDSGTLTWQSGGLLGATTVVVGNNTGLQLAVGQTLSGTGLTGTHYVTAYAINSPTSKTYASGGAAGSNTITFSTSTNLAVGKKIENNGGTGIPADTYITAVNGSTVTLSKNLTAQASSTYNVGYTQITFTSAATGNISGNITTGGTNLTLASATSSQVSGNITFTGKQLSFTPAASSQISGTISNIVTVNSSNGLKTRAQWSAATLIKRSSGWVLVGDVTA